MSDEEIYVGVGTGEETPKLFDLPEYTFPAVWDSSTMQTAHSCWHKLELSFFRNLKPKGKSIHLHAGAAFAKGLEATRRSHYSNGRSTQEALPYGIEALVKAYGDFDPGPNTAKTLHRMCGALEFYFSEFPMETDPSQVIMLGGKPAVEFSFAIPIPIDHPDTGEPLLFAGKFDSINRFSGGNYANDEKTTSSLGATWSRQWELRGQFCGYAWAMREHGIPVAGTIVTGVSILKTKYEQQRAIVYQPDWKIDEWYRDTLQTIEQAKRLYEFREKGRKCWGEACNEYGGCQFRSTVCSTQDPLPWLNTYFEMRPWNPLDERG